MSKDYARNRPSPKKRKKPTRESGLPSWLWALVGLTGGLVIAAIAFIVMRPVEPEIARAHAPTVQATPVPGPQIPPQQEARFKFYDELPKVQVRPSEDAYQVEKAPENAASNSYRYLIQAGSFRAREDAERRKANLALLGFESSVQQVDLQVKGTRFRVQIGPPMPRDAAEKAMRQLADHDIDSYPSRVDS